MYVLVSPFSKSFDDNWLTYLVPDFLEKDIKIWCIVEIPIKDSIEIWLVLNISNVVDWDYDEFKIKSLISIKNTNIFLSNYRIELVKWIAKKYITPIHNSLNLFFPKNLKEKILKDKLKIDEKNNKNYSFHHKVLLSDEQNNSYKKIIKSKNNKILFYWLTWSWKTEIYIKLIKNNLDNNKQTLFLIPEIILTNQLADKIIEVFWKDVLVINSSVSDAIKTKYWLSINNGEAKVIIWTRSAIFYPYNNLWLIIIDEEHDNSYISDSAPRYKTIEVAEKITELNWNKLILASWTPSINSMYKWIKWEYDLINLLEVYNKKTM
jgi:primosomal protein N' (replication factor Y)